MRCKLNAITCLSLACAAPVVAQAPDSAFYYTATQCPSCAQWNGPQQPFRIYGNTWFVGTRGLSAILITSPQGHILIDGGIPASAPEIIAHIRALNFLVEDVRLIVNSHAHYDHAGGIAALQRASGATVALSPWSAGVVRAGTSGRGDPQFGILLPFAPVRDIRTIADGETLKAGSVSVTAHFTPGHTPGGTSWTWRSCEGDRCMDMVYADSQTPISADGFFYTKSADYPNALGDFEHGLGVLENLPCDILLTPHPTASNLWDRIANGTIVDASACKRFVAGARAAVAKRVATERGTP